MPTPIPGSSPITNFIRWLMASIANLVHLVDGAHSAAAAPLPEAVQHVPAPATMQVWGQIFQVQAELMTAAFRQVADAFVTRPWLSTFELVAMIWLCIETVLLVRVAITFIMSKRG